jgi:hypothetical protein
MMNDGIENEFDTMGNRYDCDEEFYNGQVTYEDMTERDTMVDQNHDDLQLDDPYEINENNDVIEPMLGTENKMNHSSKISDGNNNNTVHHNNSSFPLLSQINEQLEAALSETKGAYKEILQELVTLQNVATKVKSEWDPLKAAEIDEAKRLEDLEAEVREATWTRGGFGK